MRVIGAVLIIMILVGALKSCFGDSEPTVSNAERMCSDDGYAWVMAGNFVKRGLKSPDSAKFPSSPDSYSYLGNCRHSISGSVDSQNSFGAMMRSTFSVDVVYSKSDNRWRAENLIIQ